MSNTPNDWHRTGRRTGIMLAYPFEERRLSKWEPPYIIQPKLDGERCRVVIDSHGAVTLFSSEANEIWSVPHINAAFEDAAQRHNLKGVELDGELYTHGLTLDGEDGIHAIVSTKNDLHPRFEEMQFHLFDIVNNEVQAKRLIQVNSLPNIEFVHKVPFTVARDFAEVMGCLKWSQEQEYEGIIVRHMAANYIRRRSIWMMKFKPRREDVYRIVGFEQEVSIAGIPKESIGAFICIGNENEETFNVGSGFTREQREYYWSIRHALVGRRVAVKYQHLTSARGVPRSAVFAELVEE